MTQEQLYHCLSTEEWVRLTQLLTYSEIKVLYYILTSNPMGDRRVDCRIRSIAQALDISTGSVSNALKSLDHHELIKMEITEAIVTIKPRLISTQAQKVLDRQQRKNQNVSDSEPLNDVHSTEHHVHSTEHDVHSTEHDVHSTEQANFETPSEQGVQESPPDQTLYTDLNSYSLSDSDEREKKADEVDFWLSEAETLPVSDQTSNNSSLVKIKDPVQDKFAAPRTTSRIQSVAWDWLPEGPWKVDGKLDPNFRDAIAHDWINRYGGDIHQRRADVLTHFKKDPANLPIRWEQYASEYLHRYQNTQTRLNNGLSVNEEYQQRLIANHRAITEPLPEELNPVAQLSKSNFQAAIADAAVRRQHTDDPTLVVQAQPILSPSNSIPSNAPDAENAAAYQLWEQSPLEGEQASPEQFQEFMRSLKSSFSMPKPTEQQHTTDPLEELNLWIRDPILRPEAMKRIAVSDRYTVEFDEFGNPIAVVEVRS